MTRRDGKDGLVPVDDGWGDGLDVVLGASSPRVSEATPELGAAIAELVEASSAQAEPRASRRGLRTVAFAGLGALVLGGAGAAAAAAGWNWHAPWADQALVRVHYTAPSGRECDWIAGGLSGSAEAVAAAEAYARSVDLEKLMDVDAALAQVKIGSADGSPLPSDIEDTRYEIALGEATYKVFTDELVREGISIDGFSMPGESHCAGESE